jgi:hypothetical protein
MCEELHEIEIHWNNSVWLRARSHMTSYYTWGYVTTLHIFGGVSGWPLDTFFWALTISWSRLLALVWSGPKLVGSARMLWGADQATSSKVHKDGLLIVVTSRRFGPLFWYAMCLGFGKARFALVIPISEGGRRHSHLPNITCCGNQSPHEIKEVCRVNMDAWK